MFALSLVAICIVFGAVGQILMNNGMSQVGTIGGLGTLISPDTIIRIFTNVHVLGGLLLYGIAAFLWLGALSSLNVSFMYPLLSLGCINGNTRSHILEGGYRPAQVGRDYVCCRRKLHDFEDLR